MENILDKVRDSGDVGSAIFTGSFQIGRQLFSNKITCIEYVDGYTLIGFKDGRVAKIIGTGGTGQNMFNIKKSPNGFF